MVYCTKEDLFEACLQSAIEQWATDHSSETQDKIYTRIHSAITRASEEMNLYISKQYKLPLPFTPLSLRDICVKLSLYQLLSRKGFTTESADMSIKINYDSAIKQLEQLASGRLDIGIVNNSSTNNTSAYFPKSPIIQRIY